MSALVVVLGVISGLSAPSARQEPEGGQRLAQVLNRARAYCLKLEKAALDFTCLEKIEERTYRLPEMQPDAVVDSPGAGAGRVGYSYPTPRAPYYSHRYVYDYQFIRKAEQKVERRTLIEEDGRKMKEDNAELATQTIRVQNALFGPIGLLGEQWQVLHDYRIIGEEVREKKKIVIIEAVPKPSAPRPHCFGTVWVREDDGSIVKIAWNQESVGNFLAIQQTARRLKAEPQLTSLTEYDQEKNGIRFPSKDTTEEAYLKNGKKYVQSLTTILYKDYKFFTVETEVRY